MSELESDIRSILFTENQGEETLQIILVLQMRHVKPREGWWFA